MFVCAIMAVVASVAVPVSLAGVDRARGWAAARFVAARLVKARAQAVGRGASVAVRVEGEGHEAAVSSFADANRTGVLTREIDDGDRPASRRSGHARRAVSWRRPSQTKERSGSFRSRRRHRDDGKHLPRSRDGSRFAMRVLGITARVRIERYVPARNEWVEGF